MRRYTIAALVLTAAAGIFWFGRTLESAPPLSSPDTTSPSTTVNEHDAPLIVHEWGTFTSFSGSDGVPLQFRPLTTSDLPPFVLSLADMHGRSLRKASLTAFQRMETPVTYFYTPVERDVSVRVDFPNGLLTEFYPPPRKLNPTAKTFTNTFFTGLSTASSSSLEHSMLDWGHLHLIPTNKLVAHVADEKLARKMGRFVERTMVPDSSRHPHYAKARNTDSAMVHLPIDPSDKPGIATMADHFEKFLFYRGVSNFESLIQVQASGNDDFAVRSNEDSVTSLFLVSVDNGAIRFTYQDALNANESVNLRLPKNSSSLDSLSAAVVAALTDEGLYPKEAQAMVDTWSTSWFNEPGTRLFYVLPQQKTDKLLPLSVKPQPQEVVRIMVGRLELMTPEQEQQLESTIAGWLAAEPATPTERQRYQLDQKHLESLKRWAEPSLQRVIKKTQNDSVKTEAARLLAVLQGKTETFDSQLVQ